MKLKTLLLALLASPLAAQVPDMTGSDVAMGHLHVLVDEADYEAHRKAWIEGLGAKIGKAGPLEALLIPGTTVVIKKGKSAGGSEGTTVNHLGFLVRDLDAAIERWTGHGYEVFPERPSDHQAFLRFPGNIKAELSEDPLLITPIAHHHIHLYTTDVMGVQAWYLKHFGGTAGERGRFKEVWYPGVRVSIAEAESKPVGSKGRGIDHIGFEVDGLEAFCKKLEGMGVKFDVPYKEVPAINASVAFLTDPWGTYIELTDGLDKIK